MPKTKFIPTLQDARDQLRQNASASDAEFLQRYFKTGVGEYGAGDRFIGVRVPTVRCVAKYCRELSLTNAQALLHSEIHEERLLALIILVEQFKKADEAVRKEIYQLYLHNTQFINNWDLVDSSAHHIVGVFLEDKSRKTLYRLARSKSLWERRISIMATFSFIRSGDFHDALAIAELLLNDPEDLVHKAVGWMLREIGNRDRSIEEGFLKPRYQNMPRTMLRYAIEKFPEPLRQKYLKGKIN